MHDKLVTKKIIVALYAACIYGKLNPKGYGKTSFSTALAAPPARWNFGGTETKTL